MYIDFGLFHAMVDGCLWDFPGLSQTAPCSTEVASVASSSFFAGAEGQFGYKL
jgi:hypothetical protein